MSKQALKWFGELREAIKREIEFLLITTKYEVKKIDFETQHQNLHKN